MAVVDRDRNGWAEDAGYTTRMYDMVPATCSPKNNAIVGWRQRLPATKGSQEMVIRAQPTRNERNESNVSDARARVATLEAEGSVLAAEVAALPARVEALRTRTGASGTAHNGTYRATNRANNGNNAAISEQPPRTVEAGAASTGGNSQPLASTGPPEGKGAVEVVSVVVYDRSAFV